MKENLEKGKSADNEKWIKATGQLLFSSKERPEKVCK